MQPGSVRVVRDHYDLIGIVPTLTPIEVTEIPVLHFGRMCGASDSSCRSSNARRIHRASPQDLAVYLRETALLRIRARRSIDQVLTLP